MSSWSSFGFNRKCSCRCHVSLYRNWFRSRERFVASCRVWNEVTYSANIILRKEIGGILLTVTWQCYCINPYAHSILRVVRANKLYMYIYSSRQCMTSPWKIHVFTIKKCSFILPYDPSSEKITSFMVIERNLPKCLVPSLSQTGRNLS